MKLLLLCVLVLAGCSREPSVDELNAKEQERLAREAVGGRRNRPMKIPLALLALALPCAAATLEWDANTETNLGLYRVYHGSLSRHTSGTVPYLISTNSTTNTTFTITNLVNGSNFFAVTAVDTDNLESDWSDEVFLVWTNRPAKVQGLRFAPTLNAQSAPTPTGPWSPEVQLVELELTAQSRFYRLAIAVPDSSLLMVPKRLRFDGSKSGKLPLMIPKRPRQGLPFPG